MLLDQEIHLVSSAQPSVGYQQRDFEENLGESVICEFQCGQSAQSQVAVIQLKTSPAIHFVILMPNNTIFSHGNFRKFLSKQTVVNSLPITVHETSKYDPFKHTPCTNFSHKYCTGDNVMNQPKLIFKSDFP